MAAFYSYTDCMFLILTAFIFAFFIFCRLAAPSPPSLLRLLPSALPIALAGKQHTVAVCSLCVPHSVHLCVQLITVYVIINSQSLIFIIFLFKLIPITIKQSK